MKIGLVGARVRTGSHNARTKNESILSMDAGQQKLVLDIVEIATADLALRPMLSRITAALLARLHCDLVAVIRVDHDSRRFTCEALSLSEGTDSVVTVGYSRDFGEGVVGRVAAQARSIVVDDARLDPDYVAVMPGALSEICVPLIYADQVIGLLNAESKQVGAFTGTLPLLRMIAQQLAPTIAAAQLIEALEQRTWLSETTSALTREVLGETDLNNLLQTALRSLFDRLGLCFATISLREMDGDQFAFAALLGEADPDLPPVGTWQSASGLVARALGTGRTQWAPNVEIEPDYVAVCSTTRAEYVVPLVFRSELLGAINLEAPSARNLQLPQRSLVDAFALELAPVLHMARIYKELETQQFIAESQAQALVEANRKLTTLSEQDGLTGIANRRRFEVELEREWARAQRHPHHLVLGLIMIDVDHFKALNDAQGHLAGDDCLRQVASCLQAQLKRADEFVARYGGEEFAVLLVNADAERVEQTAHYLRLAVAALRLPHPTTGVVHISCGAAIMRAKPAVKCTALIACADRALYAAKASGRNQVEFDFACAGLEVP